MKQAAASGGKQPLVKPATTEKHNIVAIDSLRRHYKAGEMVTNKLTGHSHATVIMSVWCLEGVPTDAFEVWNWRLSDLEEHLAIMGGSSSMRRVDEAMVYEYKFQGGTDAVSRLVQHLLDLFRKWERGVDTRRVIA